MRLLPVRPDHVGRGACSRPRPTLTIPTSMPAMAREISAARCGTYVRIRDAIKQAASGRQS